MFYVLLIRLTYVPINILHFIDLIIKLGSKFNTFVFDRVINLARHIYTRLEETLWKLKFSSDIRQNGR